MNNIDNNAQGCLFDIENYSFMLFENSSIQNFIGTGINLGGLSQLIINNSIIKGKNYFRWSLFWRMWYIL